MSIFNHTKCVAHHGNEKVDHDNDDGDLVKCPHEHGDHVGEFVGGVYLSFPSPIYTNWALVICIQKPPEHCVEELFWPINLICRRVVSCVLVALEWLEHCPQEDAIGAEHNEVDNDGFQHILQHLDDADNKGPKGREEKEEPHDLEKFSANSDGDECERPVEMVVS